MSVRSGEREFRGEDERLAEWRRAILWRQRRLDELARVPDPGYHERNLAARPGAVVRVDSFLGTTNSEDAAGAYAPPERLEAAGFAFRRETLPHPRLDELRQRFGLEEVAGAGGDLERAVRLRSWLKSLWRHGLPYRNPPYDGLLIVDRATRGVETFICMHYSVALIHCCLSLGMQGRLVNLHRGIADDYPIGEEASVDPPVDEHVTTEVFCRELGRWAMLDPDFDCHYERAGAPLNAWDLHRAFVDGTADGIEVCKGPGAADYASLGEGFYGGTLLSYYAHVSLLMRNDFLSDPDGPIPALHPVDAATPPILWHQGGDMRLRPDLLGPLVVAAPYGERTPVLTDGNLETGWASADTAVEHRVEIALDAPQPLARIALHWPEWRARYRTSAAYRVEAREAGRGWRTLVEVDGNPERPWTVHDVATGPVEAVRIAQPPGGGFPEHPNRLWLTQVELL